MKYPEKMLLKLPVGTLARIDCVSGNRSDFVRVALDAALSGVPVYVDESNSPPAPAKDAAPVVAAVPPKNSNVPGRDHGASCIELLDWLGSDLRTEREISDGLVWSEMRVRKVLSRLASDGKVKYTRGLVEAL